MEHRGFLDLHGWGCPVYILNKTLSDGKKTPKWKPRSQRCIYIRLSKKHAASINVVFNDCFATIASSIDNLPDFNSDECVEIDLELVSWKLL
jgi:hypothetical protein